MLSERTDGGIRDDVEDATGTTEALVEAAPVPAARPADVARLPGIGPDRAAAYMLALQRGHGNAGMSRMLLQRAPAQTDDPGAAASTAQHRATSDNLRPLIENLLEAWKRAAGPGSEFASGAAPRARGRHELQRLGVPQRPGRERHLGGRMLNLVSAKTGSIICGRLP